MLLLVLFALVAGAGTAISPCVLPVLPALLSAGATGGRRRPLGVVFGLTVTFTLTIVGLAKAVNGVGLGPSLTRDIAIVALLVFGVAIAVPAVGDRLEAPLSRLARFGPKTTGDGFVSGLGVGAALGFVYAPCAGPILAAVIAVSAATGKTFVIGAAYAIGSAVVLFALSLGGRSVLERVRRGSRGPTVQRTLGAIMAVTAIAMAFQLDVRFQTAIAKHLPAGLVNPTKGIEDSSAVKKRLADLRPTSRFEKLADAADAKQAAARKASLVSGAALPGVTTPTLTKLGPAPDFTGNQKWFNTANGKPLTLAELRGRVVLVDFWTYTCINCLRTLPYLKAWDAKYRSKGLTIVGVHSPEFSFEKVASNVQAAIKQNGIKYPVAQDNNLATWNAWGNQYWPAEYLIDANGQVRHVHFGEGEYKESEAAIRAVLAERGATGLGTGATAKGAISVSTQATPETYLGSARSEGALPSKTTSGQHVYKGLDPSAIPINKLALKGSWSITDEAALAVSGASLDFHIQAKRAYLVLSSPGKARDVRVTLDGKPYRTVHVTRQKLYELMDMPQDGEHQLHLDFAPGVSGFAFTFG